MVNKTAVGLLGVIIVASLGVGILIGMQLGGGDAPVAASPSTDGPTETQTGDQDDGMRSDATATPTENPAEPRTTVPARQFDEGEIASHVAQFVNDERRERGRQQLSASDSTATSVAEMASDHSVAMADEGTVSHEINGVGTAGRYKNYELFERCKFKSPEGSYIQQPDEKFEMVGMTYAGTHYENGGEEQFNGDERSVARAIVDDWIQSSEYTERFLMKGPTRMGVGIEVTDGGKVFATVDLCA